VLCLNFKRCHNGQNVFSEQCTSLEYQVRSDPLQRRSSNARFVLRSNASINAKVLHTGGCRANRTWANSNEKKAQQPSDGSPITTLVNALIATTSSKKIMGCPHVICQTCRHEFCFSCGADWSKIATWGFHLHDCPEFVPAGQLTRRAQAHALALGVDEWPVEANAAAGRPGLLQEERGAPQWEVPTTPPPPPPPPPRDDWGIL
jgi:hypothetical protein